MKKRCRDKTHEAILYAITHVYKNISLSEVSKAVSYSPFYFHRIFLLEKGIPFREFHLNNRLMLSAGLLFRDKNLKITKLAEKLGFSSPANFSRAFSKAFKISPKFAKDTLLADKNIEDQIRDTFKALEIEFSLKMSFSDSFYIVYEDVSGIRGGSLDIRVEKSLRTLEQSLDAHHITPDTMKFVLCSNDFNWFKNQNEMDYDIGIIVSEQMLSKIIDMKYKKVEVFEVSKAVLKMKFQDMTDFSDGIKYLTWVSEFMYMYWIDSRGYYLDDRQGINIFEIDAKNNNLELSCLLPVKKNSKI